MSGHTDYSASGSSGRAGFKVTGINTHWSEKNPHLRVHQSDSLP